MTSEKVKTGQRYEIHADQPACGFDRTGLWCSRCGVVTEPCEHFPIIVAESHPAPATPPPNEWEQEMPRDNRLHDPFVAAPREEQPATAHHLANTIIKWVEDNPIDNVAVTMGAGNDAPSGGAR